MLFIEGLSKVQWSKYCQAQYQRRARLFASSSTNGGAGRVRVTADEAARMLSSLRVLAWRVLEQGRRVLLQRSVVLSRTVPALPQPTSLGSTSRAPQPNQSVLQRYFSLQQALKQVCGSSSCCYWMFWWYQVHVMFQCQQLLDTTIYLHVNILFFSLNEVN